VNDSFWFGDTALLIYLALVTVIVHMIVGQRYGIHRDELATLDDARHLAWARRSLRFSAEYRSFSLDPRFPASACLRRSRRQSLLCSRV